MSLKHTLYMLALFVASATSAQADYVDFNMDSNSFQLKYGQITNFEKIKINSALMEVGYLHSQDPNDAANIFTLGLVTSGDNFLAGSTTTTRIGTRVLFANALQEHILAMGLGGRLQYFPKNLPRWGFVTELYYAPEITSLIDGRSFLEVNMRAGYQVLPQASLYIGWNFVNVKFQLNGSTTLNNDVRVGIAVEYE